MCEYDNIFHELLEPIDSHFSKIFTFTFYYEANNGNTLSYKEFEEFSIDLLNNMQLCIDKEQNKEEKNYVVFRYPSRLRCCARGRIAILIRYTRNTPLVQN